MSRTLNLDGPQEGPKELNKGSMFVTREMLAELPMKKFIAFPVPENVELREGDEFRIVLVRHPRTADQIAEDAARKLDLSTRPTVSEKWSKTKKTTRFGKAAAAVTYQAGTVVTINDPSYVPEYLRCPLLIREVYDNGMLELVSRTGNVIHVPPSSVLTTELPNRFCALEQHLELRERDDTNNTFGFRNTRTVKLRQVTPLVKEGGHTVNVWFGDNNEVISAFQIIRVVGAKDNRADLRQTVSALRGEPTALVDSNVEIAPGVFVQRLSREHQILSIYGLPYGAIRELTQERNNGREYDSWNIWLHDDRRALVTVQRYTRATTIDILTRDGQRTRLTAPTAATPAVPAAATARAPAYEVTEYRRVTDKDSFILGGFRASNGSLYVVVLDKSAMTTDMRHQVDQSVSEMVSMSNSWFIDNRRNLRRAMRSARVEVLRVQPDIMRHGSPRYTPVPGMDVNPEMVQAIDTRSSTFRVAGGTEYTLVDSQTLTDLNGTYQYENNLSYNDEFPIVRKMIYRETFNYHS